MPWGFGPPAARGPEQPLSAAFSDPNVEEEWLACGVVWVGLSLWSHQGPHPQQGATRRCCPSWGQVAVAWDWWGHVACEPSRAAAVNEFSGLDLIPTCACLKKKKEKKKREKKKKRGRRRSEGTEAHTLTAQLGWACTGHVGSRSGMCPAQGHCAEVVAHKGAAGGPEGHILPPSRSPRCRGSIACI